ncbi:hypothetical protein K0M31_017933 [Melipona bicolor]|uniref:Uncharacterized protein n=1 Tax=Melipona bicolor TaxID=60889 RepID=A0AA40G6M0_9HYME|nr:hypothetical protein K0M31_017933 [Melipona bicolor]
MILEEKFAGKQNVKKGRDENGRSRRILLIANEAAPVSRKMARARYHEGRRRGLRKILAKRYNAKHDPFPQIEFHALVCEHASLHHRRVQPSSTYLREFLLDVRIDVPVGSLERNGSNFKARGEVSTDRIDMSRLRRTIRSAPASSIRSKLETHFPEKLSVEMFLRLDTQRNLLEHKLPIMVGAFPVAFGHLSFENSYLSSVV